MAGTPSTNVGRDGSGVTAVVVVGAASAAAIFMVGGEVVVEGWEELKFCSSGNWRNSCANACAASAALAGDLGVSVE